MLVPQPGQPRHVGDLGSISTAIPAAARPSKPPASIAPHAGVPTAPSRPPSPAAASSCRPAAARRPCASSQATLVPKPDGDIVTPTEPGMWAASYSSGSRPSTTSAPRGDPLGEPLRRQRYRRSTGSAAVARLSSAIRGSWAAAAPGRTPARSRTASFGPIRSSGLWRALVTRSWRRSSRSSGRCRTASRRCGPGKPRPHRPARSAGRRLSNSSAGALALLDRQVGAGDVVHEQAVAGEHGARLLGARRRRSTTIAQCSGRCPGVCSTRSRTHRSDLVAVLEAGVCRIGRLRQPVDPDRAPVASTSRPRPTGGRRGCASRPRGRSEAVAAGQRPGTRRSPTWGRPRRPRRPSVSATTYEAQPRSACST